MVVKFDFPFLCPEDLCLVKVGLFPESLLVFVRTFISSLSPLRPLFLSGSLFTLSPNFDHY